LQLFNFDWRGHLQLRKLLNQGELELNLRVVFIIEHAGTFTFLLSFLLPLLHFILINTLESLNLTFLHEFLDLLLSCLATVSFLLLASLVTFLTLSERFRAIVDQVLTQLDILRIRMLLHLFNLCLLPGSLLGLLILLAFSLARFVLLITSVALFLYL
jgi:hypothetical protein